MNKMHRTAGVALVESCLGSRAAGAIETLTLDPFLIGTDASRVDGVTLTAALNILLFQDLLDRVPSAAAYVVEQRALGKRICFDHGALRTVRFALGPTGELPAGEAAFTRILHPLGYELAGVYPLPKLRMTGRAYAHARLPDALPQFFVSELHVDAFDEEFRVAAETVFGTSRDPIGPGTKAALAQLTAGEPLPLDTAKTVLVDLFGAFNRQHEIPRLSDYQVLLQRSPEAAWIATEGNAFNHATDRVADVELLAADELARGRPIKDRIEYSASGRVRQTAHRAATVSRPFIDGNGGIIERAVPGSFYEFISRDIDPETGQLDLRFDSGNATGIFAMTRAA